jgi:uroporphyrinogen-III decarboxylase
MLPAFAFDRFDKGDDVLEGDLRLDDVRREVRSRIETMSAGGGLFLAPTHVIEPEVPFENIVAFVEAVKGGGR